MADFTGGLKWAEKAVLYSVQCTHSGFRVCMLSRTSLCALFAAEVGGGWQNGIRKQH